MGVIPFQTKELLKIKLILVKSNSNFLRCRPRKMARLSSDTVWTSIVKEPGVLKLTRLVEEEREGSKTANTSIILNWSTSPHLSPVRRVVSRKGLSFHFQFLQIFENMIFHAFPRI